jgi:hypothetical protein
MVLALVRLIAGVARLARLQLSKARPIEAREYFFQSKTPKMIARIVSLSP